MKFVVIGRGDTVMRVALNDRLVLPLMRCHLGFSVFSPWSSAPTQHAAPKSAPMSSTNGSFFDQSALTALAERLVAAARRAGADAADAIATRSILLSVQVRDGTVEESERAEGDSMGLRALVGRRQAVVSTNDIAGTSADELAQRAVAMAHAASEDRFAGLADRELLMRSFPDLDLLDNVLPDITALERMA